MIEVRLNRADQGDRDAMVYTFEITGREIAAMRRRVQLETLRSIVEKVVNAVVAEAIERNLDEPGYGAGV